MSKKKLEQAQEINNREELEASNNENKYSKIQWFFFVIVIPLLFAIAIALVVMTISGVNVFNVVEDYGQKIPGVSALIEKKDNRDVSTKAEKETVYTLQATIVDQNAKISKLEGEIESRISELDASSQEIEELTKELEALKSKKTEANIKIEELAKVYETMSAKKSAAILSEMTNEDALDIIIQLNNETRAAILEKMEPTQAADLTNLIKTEDDSLEAGQTTGNEQQDTAVR